MQSVIIVSHAKALITRARKVSFAKKEKRERKKLTAEMVC